jgi:hypothetical protein
MGLNDGVCLACVLGDLLSVGLGERLPLYLDSTAASFDELNFSYAFGGNGGVWGEDTEVLPLLPLEDLTETGTKTVGVLVCGDALSSGSEDSTSISLVACCGVLPSSMNGGDYGDTTVLLFVWSCGEDPGMAEGNTISSGDTG